MKLCYLLILTAIANMSCVDGYIKNGEKQKLTFASIKTNYQLNDANNYGCNKIDSAVLEHILRTGVIINQKEANEHYSTTECTIKGSMKINGKRVDFTYDYGGIIFFSNGMIIGCGENCCTKDYPYCSWDAHELKGY